MNCTYNGKSPVLVPDYIAYHVLNLICEEELSCDIILLDRPRSTFSNKNDENGKDESGDLRVLSKERKSYSEDHDNFDSNSKVTSGNKSGSDEEMNKNTNNGTNEIEQNEKTEKEESGQSSDRGKEAESEEGNREKGSKSEGRESGNGRKGKQSNDCDDDDDYEEERDYLAYKRKEYEGTVNCKLTDGHIVISYNTEKDKIRERKAAANESERRIKYHKTVQLDFEQFYLTIDRRGSNKSVINMIIFENKHNSYEVRFRVDPKFGRDVFYYSIIAFQKCYEEQRYDWDESLKSGDVIPIKELIQSQLETLSLRGFI